MFNFSTAHLDRLIQAHHYDIRDEVVLFALRGCLPTNLQDITRSALKPLRQEGGQLEVPLAELAARIPAILTTLNG